MATGHAKFTGGVGCCLATHGPGAVHLLNGLYDAKLDGRRSSPWSVSRRAARSAAPTSRRCDLVRLFKDVCAAYLAAANDPSRSCRGRPGGPHGSGPAAPTGVILPHDVQASRCPPSPARPRQDGEQPRRATSACCRPEREDSTRRPRCWPPASGPPSCRQGAVRPAVDEVLRTRGAPGRRRRHVAARQAGDRRGPPARLRVIGHLGTNAAQNLMGRVRHLADGRQQRPVDRVLSRARPGPSRPDRHRRPPAGHALPDRGRPRRRRGPTLRELLPRLPASAAATVTGAAGRGLGRRLVAGARSGRALEPGVPLNPQRVFHELSHRLPADALVAVDVGSVTYWYARHLRLPPRRPGPPVEHAGLDGLGPAVRAGRQARPPRPAGGGADRGRRDADERDRRAGHGGRTGGRTGPTRASSSACCDNRDLAEVTWEQREIEGDPRFDAPRRCRPSRMPATPGCSASRASGSRATGSGRLGMGRGTVGRPAGPDRGRGRPGGPAAARRS